MKVYICSRYRADKENEFELYQEYTKRVAREVVLAGHTVIIPHLYYPLFLNDNIPEEREIGMKACLDLLEVCDIMLVNTKYGISEGMQKEIDYANKISKPILSTNAEEYIKNVMGIFKN